MKKLRGFGWVVWKQIWTTYFPLTKKHFRKWNGDISLTLGKSIGGWSHLLASNEQQDSFTVMRLEEHRIQIWLHPRPTSDSSIKKVEAFPSIALNIPDNLDLPNHPAIQSLSVHRKHMVQHPCLHEQHKQLVHANMTCSCCRTLGRLCLLDSSHSKTIKAVQQVNDLSMNIPSGKLNHPRSWFRDIAFEEAEGRSRLMILAAQRSKNQSFKSQRKNAEPHAQILIQENQDNKGASYPSVGFENCQSWKS